MNKICTSLEQSKKLMKLGIDRKTSDMYYWCGSDLRIGGHRAQDEELDIPAWSLAALMESMNRNCYNVSLNCHGAEWDLECARCGLQGYVIETGEIMEE